MIPLLCLVRPVSPKEVYDGGAQLSRLVSTVCVCEEGGVAIYVCVSPKDPSAVPWVCFFFFYPLQVSRGKCVCETSGTLRL